MKAPSKAAAASSLMPSKERSTFFRQSGWLMIANIGGGMLMWLVHFLSKLIPNSEYGIFVFLLSIVMLVPSFPLQMVFAQQTAKDLALGKDAELSSFLRRTVFGILAIWIVCLGALFFFQPLILRAASLPNAAGLWITAVAVLLQVFIPIFWGVLQGQQNFLWLGWSMISSGIGRIVVATAAVLLIQKVSMASWYAAGMMGGAAVGLAIAVGIAIWQSRGLWLTPPQRFDWSALARQVIPVLLAFLGFQVLFTADTLFVRAYFPNQTDLYGSAGTLSRALMWLVGPMATVLFPRLVHSAAKGEKQNLTGLVLLGTAILGAVGALGLSIVGPLVIKLVYKASFATAASLLPWYAGAMVPLSVANVLLNDLMAKPSSKGALGAAVFALAIAYAIALTQFHRSLIGVLQIVCLFNTMLLAICGYFTWRAKAEATTTGI